MKYIKIINRNKFAIALLVIFLFLLCLLFNNYFKTREYFEQNINFTAITYENSETPTNTDNLKTLFENGGYNYKIVGKNKNWDGWYGRLIDYSKEVDNIYTSNNHDHYILLCDGRDVVINEKYDDFIQKAIEMYNKNNKTIIFGAERHCCAGNSGVNSDDKYKNLMKDIAKDKTENDYYYLNFGLIFGKVADIKTFFEILNIQPGDTDQSLAVVEFCNNPHKYSLDYDQEIFCNNSGECKLEWDDNLKKFKNTNTNTYPSILHFPGGNHECYKQCTEKLFIDIDDEPEFYN
jgi:hypothetical protein